ncbi:OTU-like cysteine protease domain-containing protein, putative [Eimeria mitis]|uniref:OTU-like cysteine protease domain-containing protein, putative n=1 Tax=Eimeria mitis TaxID=44415 RepID=U6KLA0_9EIME|nr:OTU-like cysteine protease domain-containing protein, putative [Eimeria mitis]CDJ36233.1 OTU-like cysteine protease domain-containing protein, putative [Eimeria mitis]
MVRSCFDSKVLTSSSSSSSLCSDDGYAYARGAHEGPPTNSSDASPAVLPMTEDDFVLLDRLERRVDAQSFATVLKAYLIVRNRIAAIRADKEFKKRQLSLPRSSVGDGVHRGTVAMSSSSIATATAAQQQQQQQQQESILRV